MTANAVDVGIELERAGIPSAALNGDGPPGWEAVCPCCGTGGVIRWREGDHGWTCANDCDPSRIADEIHMRSAREWNTPAPERIEAGWLDGIGCDPFSEPPEPLPSLPGIPFTYRPASVLITAPTGTGKSCLLQAGLYDLATAASADQMRAAYLSGEVDQGEFNARARDLAERRGDDLEVDGPRLDRLARCLRWLDLGPVIEQAWADPHAWADDMARLYSVVAIDPVSSVASALGLDFDKSNSDYVAFHDRLIKPLLDRGLVVLQADNIGHASEAKNRAKGASAKQDKADVVVACSLRAGPALSLKAVKVRSVRAPFKRGDVWTFDRDTQRISSGDHEEAPADTFRPTVLMERVSRAIEADPGITRRAIRTAVGGNHDARELALELLIAERYVNRDDAAKWPTHQVVTPFRADDETVPKPSPKCPPGPLGAVVAPTVPMPPALKGAGDRGHSDQDRADDLEARYGGQAA